MWRAAILMILFPNLARAETHEVTVGDNFFSPNDLTINVGDTVRWSYDGSRNHDVTADDLSWGSVTSSSFTYERTFDTAGEVLYHCTVHSSPGLDINTFQNGRIEVVGTVENLSPTSGFSFGCTDLDCSFTDQSTDSDGTISAWSWDFGDGAMSATQNPGHAYAAAGTYVVSLTVTDDDGAQDTSNQSVTVSSPPPPPPPEPDPVVINVGMMDAWFDPATAGQGFLITVWPDIEFMFLAWFTFDTERPPEDIEAILGDPGHRWITAQGSFSGDTAVLDVFLTSGGTFDSAEPAAVTDPAPIGSMTIHWTGCNAATVDYDIPALDLVGEVPIERIVPEHVAECEAGQP
jgi:PKD repeat protein